MPSKALEINLAKSRVDVAISDQYQLLQEVMSKYQGVMEGLEAFLKEVCHPLKNWQFTVKEARNYALNYFHLLNSHPRGPEAAMLFLDIFLEAIEGTQGDQTGAEAADSLVRYFQKILKNAGKELPRFVPVLNYGFERILSQDEKTFFLFVKSFYQLNRVARDLGEKAPPGTDFSPINKLLIRYLSESYQHWLKEQDPLVWFLEEAGLSDGNYNGELMEIFSPVSHDRLKSYKNELDRIVMGHGLHSKSLLEDLVQLPGYPRIVDLYKEIPQRLFRLGEQNGLGNYWKLLFLLHIMKTAGLSSIHQDTLRSVNRTLTWLIGHEEIQNIQLLIQNTFNILRDSVKKYPEATLNCLLNMGKAVYKTDESDLVDFFVREVVSLGFHTPELRGVGDNWQIRANNYHVQNIRTWLELIELNPKWSKTLISSLIVNLSLGGVFIKDTDLFPRDITQFLNSDIGPVYNLAKQLARLFPAYFNEIGAEGRLRDISTKIDEVCLRKDVLVHFVRKQSHVESSNQIIGLVGALLEFWKTKDKGCLMPYIPPGIYSQVDSEGPYIDGVHTLINHLVKRNGLSRVNDFLAAADLEGFDDEVPGTTGTDRERVHLAISFYKLLYQKYHLGFVEFGEYLKQLHPRAFPDLDKLKKTVALSDPRKKIHGILIFLERLKEVILSQRHYEIREDIYRKRHIAVDIPSMYGSYRERKFDALGLTFRLEALVNTLFDDLVNNIDLELITSATFSQIYDYLLLFYRALKLDGIASAAMERQLDLLSHSLKVREFSFTQYLDIFRGFSDAVKNIVNDYFNNIHEENLATIVKQFPYVSLQAKYRPSEGPMDDEKLIHRVSEIFMRERITSSLGLQQLDVFISRIVNTLFQQSEKLPREKIRTLLNYDPQKAITPINPINRKVCDIIYLGNKGLNLVRLIENGFPIPPGFIITTEVFRFQEIFDAYPPAENNLKDQIIREISRMEKLIKQRFGDSKNPLLLSVRSGSPISLPGMMDTFLNVGINEEIVRGIDLGPRPSWFAWDCYRRFLQSYGMAFGLNRDDFDDIIADFKKRLGVPYKRQFTGEQMKEIALTYKELIRDRGIRIEESPFDQLYLVINKVFESWYSPKAKTYRRIMGISDDWGTAVTVQKMVFGNLSQESGSGVVFTHNPRWPGDKLRLWGDFTLGNQGEDVVSGLVETLPVSLEQAEAENRDKEMSLETCFPEIYRMIRYLAKHLVYNRKWEPQEMEFTFEAPSKENLFFLQTRDMAIRERKKVLSFTTTPETQTRLIGHGIGVSGGAMTGRVVYNMEEIHYWKGKEPETHLILLRGDTVPDDIMEIHETDGLLTARGGSTSHAAIVAHRLGKTCVVGFVNLICMEKESRSLIDGLELKTGDWISIDGQEGSIYGGKMKIKEA
ncbi:MAG: pyruvate, phosphate dikinase [Deltaproteobacteria bacterium]|nr:pyruvate, phosphate dikinase [Deltaproteobacteria bacterium]MBW2136719.1 pyruvate, phosphate dikinase [Deltaproteobacteria bacterium]